jgi:hypothetical protein
MRRHAIAAIGAALLLLTACGGSDEGPAAEQPIEDAPDDELPVEEPTDDPVDDETTDPEEDSAIGASDPLLGPEVEIALDDAEERAGVARDELSVTVTELVTWPDGAAGCPDPDLMYTQALVDGYRIVIEAAGDEYHYVGANGSEPTYCEDPQQPVG